MSWGRNKDMGAYFETVHAGAEVDVTAGGAGDATEVNGAWIDVKGYDSIEFVVSYTATMADLETLSLAMNFQDADDSAGTGAADVSADLVSALASTVIATAGSGGSTETGTYSVGVPTSGMKRYIRAQWTPDMSASGTDTAKITAMYIKCGTKYPAARANRSTLFNVA